MALVGPLKVYGEKPAVGVELNLQSKDSVGHQLLHAVLVSRTGAPALTITVNIDVPGWGTFVLDQIVGLVAPSWYIVPEFPLPSGAKITVTTVGVGGANQVSGVIIIQEG